MREVVSWIDLTATIAQLQRIITARDTIQTCAGGVPAVAGTQMAAIQRNAEIRRADAVACPQ
jgi:hypothetical protein